MKRGCVGTSSGKGGSTMPGIVVVSFPRKGRSLVATFIIAMEGGKAACVRMRGNASPFYKMYCMPYIHCRTYSRYLFLVTTSSHSRCEWADSSRLEWSGAAEASHAKFWTTVSVFIFIMINWQLSAQVAQVQAKRKGSSRSAKNPNPTVIHSSTNFQPIFVHVSD